MSYYCRIYELLQVNEKRSQPPRTLTAISRMTGLSYPALRKLATGESQPSLETAHRISKAIGFSVRTIWPPEQFGLGKRP